MDLKRFPLLQRLILIALYFPLALLHAHPGHYHPDEVDEFDFFRATFFHSHGMVDWVLLGIVTASVGVALSNNRRTVKTAAIAAGLSALALLPIL